MKLAIVGCTGLVGNEILNVLSELSVPITELILVASKKNIGKKVAFKTEKITIVGYPRCNRSNSGNSYLLCRQQSFQKMGSNIC